MVFWGRHCPRLGSRRCGHDRGWACRDAGGELGAVRPSSRSPGTRSGWCLQLRVPVLGGGCARAGCWAWHRQRPGPGPASSGVSLSSRVCAVVSPCTDQVKVFLEPGGLCRRRLSPLLPRLLVAMLQAVWSPMCSVHVRGVLYRRDGGLRLVLGVRSQRDSSAVVLTLTLFLLSRLRPSAGRGSSVTAGAASLSFPGFKGFGFAF